MKTKTLTTMLAMLASLSAAFGQMPDKAKLDLFLDRLAEKDKAMGTVVIAKDGKVLYVRSIGYGQVTETERKPLTPASKFRIGSITKMFTCVMILQLAEEGKLKLSDRLDKFFPRVPNAGEITIAQLLEHRSGVPNVRREPSGNTTPITKDEILALIAKGKPDFEPGAKRHYSNSGYFLLGLILEKSSGKAYAEALKERITSKIGLRDTYTATGNVDIGKNESLAYIKLGDAWKQVPETHPSILFGAGSIVSTPSDLAIFIQALFDLKLITQESLDQMTPIREGDGLGMESFTFAGKTFLGHTGGVDNYGAWLAYLPEEKLAVAYAANAKVYPVADIMQGVIDIYYRRPFQIPSFETIAVSPEILDEYAGTYSSPAAPVRFLVSREDSTLFIQRIGESSAAPLEATDQDTFKIGGTGMILEFDMAKNAMVIKGKGEERIFTKEK